MSRWLRPAAPPCLQARCRRLRACRPPSRCPAPPLLLERGESASAFGILFGAVFAVQTATFAVHSRHHTGPRAVVASLVLATVGLGIFLASPSFLIALAAAVPLGVATFRRSPDPETMSIDAF